MEKITLSFKEAAQVTSLSHWTLRKLAKAGSLPTIRVGRRVLVEPQALEKFIKKGQV